MICSLPVNSVILEGEVTWGTCIILAHDSNSKISNDDDTTINEVDLVVVGDSCRLGQRYDFTSISLTEVPSEEYLQVRYKSYFLGQEHSIHTQILIKQISHCLS